MAGMNQRAKNLNGSKYFLYPLYFPLTIYGKNWGM